MIRSNIHLLRTAWFITIQIFNDPRLEWISQCVIFYVWTWPLERGARGAFVPQFFGNFTYFHTNSTPKRFQFGSFEVSRPPFFDKVQRPWCLFSFPDILRQMNQSHGIISRMTFPSNRLSAIKQNSRFHFFMITKTKNLLTLCVKIAWK